MTGAPTKAGHLVARIVWNTGLEAPSDVDAHQDWLSEFSRGALPDLLTELFDRFCPPGRTWRCDRLEVDLGRIPLSRAEEELPRRLASELASALRQRFGGFTDPAAEPRQGGLEAETGDAGDTAPPGPIGATSLTVLENLLLHGSLPWWCKHPAPFLPLWSEALAEQPRNLLRLLRRVAQQETVRLRLVLLLGQGHLPDLIALAEPAHADALVEWVGTLVGRHAENRLVPDDAGGFERAAWVALLTCLFVERGSRFNTAEFARAHLRRLAQSYGLAYETLLERLDMISARQAPYLPPRFLSLIRDVLDRDASSRPVAIPPADEEAESEWRLWARMLARGQSEATAAEPRRPIRLQALFSRLAGRDGGRLARAMVAAGGPAGGMLSRHLDDKSLRRAVTLLQPGEAEFIVAHVAHAQRLARHGRWPRRAVWDVVLTFLLSEHASRFERRQLVERTLRESCRRNNADFTAALDLLIAHAQVASADLRHYSLLRILLDLRGDPASSGLGRDPVHWPAKAGRPRASQDAPNHPEEHPPAELLWKALRWRLRAGRVAPGLPPSVGRMPLADLWERLPPAELRRWVLAQPDRADLLPRLAAVPAARRWLSRLTPHGLRPIDGLLDQAVRWFGGWAGPASRAMLEPVVWRLALDPRARPQVPARFLAQCLLLWCQRLSLSVAECAARGLDAPPSPLWREALLILLGWAEGGGIAPILPIASPVLTTAGSTGGTDRSSPFKPDMWGRWLETPRGQDDILRLLCRREPLPPHRRPVVAALAAFGSTERRLAAAVYQWVWIRPESVRRLLAEPWRRASVRPRLEARLRRALALSHLLDLIARDTAGSVAGHRATRLIADWREWQHRLDLPHPAKRRDWLWRVVWQAWLNQDWRSLEPARLLASFRRFFLPLSGMTSSRLEDRLRAGQPPDAVAAAISRAGKSREAKPRESQPRKATSRPEPETPPKAPPAPASHDAAGRLPLSNAGLILLHSFLPTLFGRLGLLQDRRFPSPAEAHRAVLALQFLACGVAGAEEPHLALNKLLCGLHPSTPVPVRAEFPESDIAVMEGLLRAVIGHWPTAGTGSLEGFRGNWLLREGVLADGSDHWGLTVKRKPWDILLSKSPFSYAVITLPWMEKALYVTWPC